MNADVAVDFEVAVFAELVLVGLAVMLRMMKMKPLQLAETVMQLDCDLKCCRC